MAVTVNTTLAGPLTARFSNIYGALANLGLVSSLGAQDVTGSGDPVAPILNASQFYAPLTHSLVLTRGTGDPTYTRATVAWEFDNEGKLILVPSGAARFGGARMVRNLLTYSEDMSNAAWVAYLCTKVSTTEIDSTGTTKSALISIDTNTDAHFLNHIAISEVAGNDYTLSCDVKSGTATHIQVTLAAGAFGTGQYANIRLSDGVVTASAGCVVSTSLVGNGYYRVSYKVTASASATSFPLVIAFINSPTATRLPTFAGNGTDSFYIGFPQLENVTGQADQTASEYVSVGVLSAPYHGAGVDGIKYFNTNKDGSAISESSLLGNHAEGARTNSLMGSRDLTNAAWAATNITPAKTATGIDNAANSASTLTAGAADATILQTLTLAAAARSFSAYVKRRTGTGSVYITRDGGTSWTDITSSLGASWTRVKIENTSVLNPSVGFKIATSGDEIDVDVCQDEAGAFITSPIVTTTAAVTRNRDNLLYQFAGNASGTEGTLLAEGVIGSTTLSNASMITLRAGASSYNNFIALVLQGNGDYARLECYSGGAAQVGISTTNATSTHKASARYKTNDFAISSNGGAVVTDTSGNIPASLDTLMIGTDAGNAVLSSYIKNAYIWSTALTDAQLQQVTA